MSELGCADGCGRRGCKGANGNAWGEVAAGDGRALMHGRLRTAWAHGNGSKGVGGNGWGEGGAVDERAQMRGRLWLAWVEMGGNKEPLEMGELGCQVQTAWLQWDWVEIGGRRNRCDRASMRGRADGVLRTAWVQVSR
eukprot:s2974_g9.t1